MKRFLVSFVGLLLATAGTLAAGTLSLRVSADLFLIPVAAAARPGTPVAAMLTGLAAGLLQDAVSAPGRLFGLNAFAKVLVGYVLANIGARIVVAKPVSVGLLLWATCLGEALVVAGLCWVLRGELLAPAPVPLAVRALLTGVLGGAIHAAVRFPWAERWRLHRRRRG